MTYIGFDFTVPSPLPTNGQMLRAPNLRFGLPEGRRRMHGVLFVDLAYICLVKKKKKEKNISINCVYDEPKVRWQRPQATSLS
jgi:hypothetical protein